ncbi:hypothetical protein SteCoe_431 [Stentor coeruleus]|uniref:Uncharacterized protein n=1 Tax=Stentor coeruleus TaxID=5963 RepID=A0A1R2D461_9CILI|nr:hypothetical protein SteCoe_431 [Stentor coeruleus]
METTVCLTQTLLDKNPSNSLSQIQSLSPEYNLSKCFSQAKTTLEGHLNFVKGLCLTNDENYLISSSNDLTIKIWNLATKKEEVSIIAHEKSVHSISLSKDNKYLISGSLDSTIKVWDFPSRQALFTLTGHEKAVNSAVIHPDGKTIVSGSSDQTIKIWDFDSKSLSGTIQSVSMVLKVMIYEIENFVLASHSNGLIAAFNLKTQLQEFVLESIDSNLSAIILRANNEQIYSCSDTGKILLWDLPSRSLVYELKKSEGGATCLALSVGLGILASAHEGNYIKVWDLTRKKAVSIFTGHTMGINSLVISDKHKAVISSSSDRKIMIWDLNEKMHSEIFFTKTEIYQLRTCKTFGFVTLSIEGKVELINKNKIVFGLDTEKITSVCFHEKNNLIVTGSDTGVITTWTIKGDKKSYSKPIKQIITVIETPKNNDIIVAGFNDFSIKIYNIDSLNLLKSFKDHTEKITSICFFNENDNFVTGSKDKTLKVWSLKFGKLFKLLGHKDKVLCTKTSPDDKYILSSSSDGFIKVWNYMKRIEEREIFSSQSPVSDIVCIPTQNAFASVSHDGNITIWSFQTFNSICVINGKSSKLYGIDLYENETCLITCGSEAFVKYWKINKKSPISSSKISSISIKSIVLSDDGGTAFCSTEKNIVLYDIYDKKEINKIKAHTKQINSLDIIKNSNKLISCSDDNTIKIWDTKDLTLLDTLNSHTSCVNCIKITSDGQYLYSGSDDKSIKKTILSTKQVVQTLIGHSSLIYSISLNKSETLLASSSKDLSVKVWDLITGTCIGTFKGHTKDVVSVLFTDDSKYVISSSNDNTIKIWNIISEREEFTFTGHKGYINSIYLCRNKKTILSASNDQTVKMWDLEGRNLLYTFEGVSSSGYSCCTTKDENLMIIGHVGVLSLWEMNKGKDYEFKDFCPEVFFDHYYQHPLEYYNAYEVVKGTRNDGILPEVSNIIFGPYLFTLIHYLAYYGKVEVLQKVLNSSFTLKCDKFGKSPLYYAISKNQQDFIDCVLSFLISIKETNPCQFSQCAYAMRNDLSEIIKNSSRFLHDFLKNIFISQPCVKARIKVQFPMFQYSQASIPALEDFALPLKDPGVIKIPSICKSSSIPITTDLNSLKSLDLLQSIIECSNLEIFRSEFVQYFIELQWNALRTWVLIYTFLLLALTVFMILLLEYSPFNLFVLIPFLVINLFLISWEIMQCAKSGLNYFTDFMNILDMLRIILVIVWIVFEFSHNDIIYVTWSMMLLTLIRGLTIFRFFNKTRYYCTLIFRSLNDIKYFILIFVYSTLAFGILYMISRSEKVNFYTIWMNPYNINFGGYDGNEKTEAITEYMVFLGSTFINVVLMLNLLISILGDSFEQFQIDKDIIDYKDKAEIILEMQQVVYAKDLPCDLVFVHVCESPFSSASDDWAGKIKFIEKSIENYTKNVEIGNDKIKEVITEKNVQIMESIEKLERKILVLEDRLNIGGKDPITEKDKESVDAEVPGKGESQEYFMKYLEMINAKLDKLLPQE